MISFENLKIFLETNLLDPLNLESWGFDPHFSSRPQDFIVSHKLNFTDFPIKNGFCVWWHEEPIYNQDYSGIFSNLYLDFELPFGHPYFTNWIMNDVYMPIFANSEKSDLKKQLLNKSNFYDWYFFFHGFAALDWFSDYKYFDYVETQFDKVFISLNNNLIGKRNYRLSLLSLFIENNIDSYGYISCPKLSKNLIKNEVFASNDDLSLDFKKLIFKNLSSQPALTLDKCDYGKASASIGDIITFDSTNYHRKSMFHIVNETNFYDDKLHLTEKIFKPIAIKRPFILVAGKGNLAYLKSYGFLTFDRWIDESYDDEPNNDIRLIKIANEVKKLCSLSKNELHTMYHEMQEVLNYNHNHFYTNFKTIIVDELLTNFENCCKQYNLTRSYRYRIPVQEINFNNIRKLLLQ